MKLRILNFLGILLTLVCSLQLAAAQNGHIDFERIDPPNWWAGTTINPIRVLIKGKHLNDVSKISSPKGSGITLSNLKASANGNYLFADLAIKPKTKPGKYELTLDGNPSLHRFSFEIKERLPREGRFRGFTPDDVIYFVIPDRFVDGDTSNNDPEKSRGLYDRKFGRHYHGGDLEGLIGKLDYLKSLGVTAIWTTPFYDNNDKPDYKEMYPEMPFTTGYHGYGAVDMYGIDEHLGDEAKLREFVEKAQAKGFKVIQDQVVNHTGPYHVWAADPPTPTWWNGTLENHPNNNWQKWTAMNPRASRQTQARNIDGWFIDILPDFNQNDPEVEKYLIQHTIWWIESYGFDAIRMDTLPHVPRPFWEKWMTALKKEFPNVNVLGELFDGNPALLAYYQGGRKGHDGVDTKLDTLYDFSLFYAIRDAFAKGGEIRKVHQSFAHDWLYPRPDVLTTFLGVHDMERFMNEPGATTDGLKLAQTLIMTSRGTPLLYYGDEIAMPGGGDPDNRRDFPGGFPGDGRDAFDAAGRTAQENDVWNHLAKLGRLRQELEPLRKGKTLDLLDEPQQYAYARYIGKDFKPVIVVFNNDTQTAEVQFRVEPDTECKFDDSPPADGEKEKFLTRYWYSNPTDFKLLWLWNGNVLSDRLGNLEDVRIDCGVFKTEMPRRSAGVFTTK